MKRQTLNNSKSVHFFMFNMCPVISYPWSFFQSLYHSPTSNYTKSMSHWLSTVYYPNTFVENSNHCISVFCVQFFFTNSSQNTYSDAFIMVLIVAQSIESVWFCSCWLIQLCFINCPRRTLFLSHETHIFHAIWRAVSGKT